MNLISGFRIIVFLLFLSGLFKVYSQDTIRVAKYGLLPGSRENAMPYINRMMKEVKDKSNVVILFEKGRYDFWPQLANEKDYYISNTNYSFPRFCAVVIEGCKNLVIDCGGSDFIFHGKYQPFTIDSSENIAIKNVSINWDIPFGAEGEIIDVKSVYFDVRINSCQYPYVIENSKLYFVGEGWKNLWGGVKWNDPVEFDRESLEVTPGTDDDLLGFGWEEKYKAEVLDEGIVRINYNNTRLLKKGNYLVFRHGYRDHAGIFINGSKTILLENITMHSNLGLSFLAQYSENLTYRNVNCLPAPNRKIISGHDDGLHFSNCRGQITVEGCTMKGLMDDSFNVHGTYVLITGMINDRTLVCKFPHFQSIGLKWARPGDQVAFIDGKSMQNYGTAKVIDMKMISPESFEINFDAKIPIDITTTDALQNLTWEPDVTIRNCYFGNHRARGVLISTGGKILIEGNTFESSGSAIVFPCDISSYFENGPIKEARIINNYFKASCLTSNYMTCEAIISISREGYKTIKSHFPLHQNITIEHNTFELFDYPAVFAYSVKGINFNNNILKFSTNHKPWHFNKANLTFYQCENIQVLANKIEEGVFGKNIRLIGTNTKSLKLDEKQGFKLEN